MRPTRRRLRLAEFSYGGGHAYFVTICVAGRRLVFSTVQDGTLLLTPIGMLATTVWHELPVHHLGVTLRDAVFMPDHVHAIIEIATGASTTLGAVVGGFKSSVTRRLRNGGLWGSDPLWQRAYFDKVLRTDQDFREASRYIQENPLRWQP